ncbi:hypothetical protein GCM10017786_31290 [Amycolatopsis deserti]|uniref:Uncharacterized protein n=1 Tax=Amycolatopsis deserti TaxID=185696 RepID=A0ABQ3IX08_9PSEU|nr:hypothetical protein [Amycolatopsis deserti]GHE96448.1 hypothetical protein GCM10017786_31290 [Amycolatopsis deserti]
MINEVDDLDWEEFGLDVPELVRRVAAGDGGALDDLLGILWHDYDFQGHEPIARALPFLIELLDVPALDRVALLDVMIEINERHTAPDGEEPTGLWAAAAWQAVLDGAPAYLRLLLDDPTADAEIRARAAHLLGAGVPRGSQAVAVMERRSREDPSPVVRACLMLAVEMTGAPTAPLLDGWLADPEPLPRLVAALIAPRPPVEAACRDLAASIPLLALMPVVGDDAVTFLCERLHGQWELLVALLDSWLAHEDAATRRMAIPGAAFAIKAWRPALARLAPGLAQCLNPDADASSRWTARGILEIFAHAGTGGAVAADDLWLLIETHRGKDWDSDVLTATSFALATLCEMRDTRVGSYVADQLAAPDIDWLRLDLQVVERLGPWAAATCRRELLRHVVLAEDGELHLGAVKALARMSTAGDSDINDVVAALRARIHSRVHALPGRRPRPEVFCRLLGELGPVAAVALPDLRALLDHEAADVRIEAARAVFRISGTAAEALPLIRTGLESDDRVRALALLAELGSAGAEFADAVRDLVASEDSLIATRAAIAYWRVNLDAEPVVPALLRHLESGDLGVRAGAGAVIPRVSAKSEFDPIKEERATARGDAVRCLAEIGAEAALPMLRRTMTTDVRQIWTGELKAVAQDAEWVRLCAQALASIES